MHRSALVSALAVGLAVSGCSDGHERTWQDVTLTDGGYALVAVTVPAKHDATILFSFDGAETGEAFAVFDEPDEPPFHTGWFDMSPWMESCERDPTTSACLDVHSQNAGAFVGVARRSGLAPEVRATSECKGKKACTHYYAIVSSDRGPDRNLRVIVDTETGYNARPAQIWQVR